MTSKMFKTEGEEIFESLRYASRVQVDVNELRLENRSYFQIHVYCLVIMHIFSNKISNIHVYNYEGHGTEH